MGEPEVVTCARCLAQWPENSEDVRYAAGDWWCADESGCGDRLAKLLEDVDV